MSSRRACACAAALCASLALPVQAPARSKFPSPRLLWATVNVCDTPAHPATIGIRGSMPGSGVKRERMFMRFQVQFLQGDGTWKNIGASGDSGWVGVGSAKYKARQAGRSFTVSRPEMGTVFRLRGVVVYEWRRRKSGKVVRHFRRRTTAGHKSTAGADPPGYSAATCDIAG